MEQYEQASLYKEIELTTSDGGSLIIMIYEEVIKYLEEATELLKTENHHAYDRVNSLITKSQELITELTVSLDRSASEEMHDNLLNLYAYFNKELREANFNKDRLRIIPIISFMKELHSAWKEATRIVSPQQKKKRHGVNISR